MNRSRIEKRFFRM